MIDLVKHSQFKEMDDHYVEGVVYTPNTPDTDGQFMTVATIKKMSDRFMKLYGQSKADIDLLHNGIAGTGYLTKSAINPDGSWVVGMQIEDDSTWEAIKKGDLKGFSIFGKSELKGDEIINPQVNRISIVSKPANKQTFQVVKSEKSLIEKIYNLIKKGETMNQTDIETRLTALEESVAKILELLSQDVKEDKQEDVAKSESIETEMETLMKINQDLSNQVKVLAGKQHTQSFASQTSVIKQEKEDIFSFMV